MHELYIIDESIVKDVTARVLIYHSCTSRITM